MRNNNVDMVVHNQNGERQPMKKGYSRKAQFAVMFVIVFVILFGFSLLIMTLTEDAEAAFDEKPDREATITADGMNYSQVTDSVIVRPLDYTVTSEPQAEPPEIEDEYISLGTFRITAYCGCAECCGKYGKNRPIDEYGNTIVTTASGKRAVQGVTVAADRTMFPFGTKLYIEGKEFEVQDVGGSINGNEVDIYFENHQDALNFGVQYMEVFIKSN